MNEMGSIAGSDEAKRVEPAHGAALVTGVVLAGGLSRRMGGEEKSLKEVGGAPMLGRVIERLRLQVGRMVINANGDPARFGEFNLDVAADTVDGFAGPLAGVLTGMQWARKHTPAARWVVTVATDTPFFPDDLVTRLISACGDHQAMIALAKSGERVHPVFGLWPISLADDLEQAVREEELRKVLVWVDRHPHTEVVFAGPVVDNVETDPFFNVNTPEDLKIAETLAAELAGADAS